MLFANFVAARSFAERAEKLFEYPYHVSQIFWVTRSKS